MWRQVAWIRLWNRIVLFTKQMYNKRSWRVNVEVLDDSYKVTCSLKSAGPTAPEPPATFLFLI